MDPSSGMARAVKMRPESGPGDLILPLEPKRKSKSDLG
jgi:hypothetical protein